ncbi:uncharacterized protein LOC111296899 [Durio zibethinus]|uniref:Uncharacterized protein LOC111296899 n=1 Tax=Durio zibethinus TaxID=66656 RepID=A0A6P5Z3H4_DURZI|nr:uncharacterized protein LOC111296899 [Durio zibethinus]XP_022747120.1 uncharacterized protein LOC111296899 [Durio zibethinus]
MSDHVAKSDPDSDGTARRSMNHYQAAWMDHWKHTSHKPSTEVHNHLLHCRGQKKDDHHDSKQHPLLSGSEMATNTSKYTERFKEVSEAKTVDTMKKSLRTGSMKLGKDILDGQPLLMFINSGNRESAVSSKNNASTSSSGEAVKYQIDLNDGNNSIINMGRSEWAYPEMECPSRERKFQPEDISQVPEQLVKSQEFLEEHSVAVSPAQSFTCQLEHIAQSSPVVASKEHFMDSKFCSYSTSWVHRKKADALFKSRKLGSSLSRQNDAPLLLHDRSTNNSQIHSFLNKHSQKVENNSNIRLLPSLGCPEAMKSEKAYDEYFLLPRIPHSVHNGKTMRICTTIDSAEELPKGPSKFSQTTHQFFITKKTGVNLTEGGQVFRDAIVSPKLKGNIFNEFLSLSPNISFHGQQGVKLQPIESSTDGEGKDNAGDVRTSSVCLKNESSVETDAMELDVFQKSHLSSVALCPSDQNIKGVHNSSLPETENATGEEAGNKMVNTELPDMNEGLPALPAVANSIDDGETSTSRTQSLDAEHLLCHVKPPSNFNTAACPDSPLEPEPSSRWIKRLKLSTSDPFAHGTKSSKIEEVSSCEKVNKIFCKTSSEPTIARSHVGPQLAFDQTATQLKNGDSTSGDSVRKSQEIYLSRSWIHRWCRHKAMSPNKKLDAAVPCEPQSSKATSDELQRKQFPSIAAMALMGRAISGFHPCEFRRNGSLIVWNT